MSSTIEAYTGIICSCLPLLPPLVDKYWPKNFGSSIYKLWSSGSRRKSISNKAGSEVSLQFQQQKPWQQVNYASHESVGVQKKYYNRSDDGSITGEVNSWERIAWALFLFLCFLFYLDFIYMSKFSYSLFFLFFFTLRGSAFWFIIATIYILTSPIIPMLTNHNNLQT